MREKVVLAYSGGLDTSIILHWLQHQKNVDVYAFTAHVGQTENVDDVAPKARENGAKGAFVADLRAEFTSDYVFPMLRAMPLYEGSYLLGTSIARPIMVRALASYAREVGAKFIAHGATGKGNDQIRFELSIQALAPELGVIAPWREWNMTGREDLEAYARLNGIAVPTTPKAPWSYDGNLFHCSFEGGILEDPWQMPPEDLFKLTQNPERAPEQSELLEIEFLRGDPIGINGRRLSPASLLGDLNQIAGRHGIGRVDIVENRATGIKSRGIYETPGGTVIQTARRAVESLVLDAQVIMQRDKLAIEYSSQIYGGLWFSPERMALQSYFDYVASGVTGTARLKLFKGSCYVVGRKSPESLYRNTLASFEGKEFFDHRSATGYIDIMGRRLRNRAEQSAVRGGIQ